MNLALACECNEVTKAMIINTLSSTLSSAKLSPIDSP
jgi:hypothetical protein